MGRRKKKQQESLTLFSFQDIMACLTGVLILISLLLALDGLSDRIDDAGAPGSAAEAEAAERAEQLAAEIKALEEQVDVRKRGLPVTEDEVKVLEARAASMQRELDEAKQRDRTLAAEVARLEEEEKALIVRRQAAERTLVEQELQKRRQRVQYRPGGQQERTPLFVEVSASGLRVGKLDAERTPVMLADLPGAAPLPPRPEEGLAKALNPHGPDAYYVLFVVHPDGIKRFEALRVAVFRNGYEVGWQLWDAAAGAFLQPAPVVTPAAAPAGAGPAAAGAGGGS